MGYSSLHGNNNIKHTAEKALSPVSMPSFLTLMGGEKMLIVRNPSRLNYFWHYFFGGLFILLAIIVGIAHAVSAREGIVTFCFVVLGLILLAYAIIKGYITCYVVTDRRILAKHGLISVSVTEVRIDDIRGVNYSRGVWQAIIGTGNVVIGTAATGDAEIKIEGVTGAKEIVEKINSLRQK